MLAINSGNMKLATLRDFDFIWLNFHLIIDVNNEKGFRYATSTEKKAHRAKNKKTSLDKNPNKREQQAVIQKEVLKVLQEKK